MRVWGHCGIVALIAALETMKTKETAELKSYSKERTEFEDVGEIR